MKKGLLAAQFLLLAGLSGGALAYTEKQAEKQATMQHRTMSQASMEKVVKQLAPNAKGEKGFVEFTLKDVRMYLISDATHDRMRIVAPVAEYKSLTEPHLHAVLESNFHKALDARYAVSDGILYSMFIHPLSSLTKTQIKSAVEQVTNLALSFGTTYTSGVLDYGGKQ